MIASSRSIIPLLWLLSACAAFDRPPAPRIALAAPAEVFERLVLQSPHGMVPDQDVLALNDQMRASIAGLRLRPMAERAELLARMFADGGAFGLVYDQRATRSAIDTFATRTGNCLAYTQLFVAMARELGMHARFREERAVATWTRVGDLLVLSRHMTVWGTNRGHIFEVDFGILGDLESVHMLIDDQRARAQYFNNLGGEALARRAPREGVRQLNRALALDPSAAFIWSNLGIALGMLGDIELAEIALLHALRLAPTTLSAANGLVGLYQRTGGTRLAEAYARSLRAYRARNPFHHHQLGVAALELNAPADAVGHLRRAVRLKGDEADFHFELGRALLGTGRWRDAMTHFERNIELTTDPDQQRIYARRLEKLLPPTPGVPASGAPPAHNAPAPTPDRSPTAHAEPERGPQSGGNS